MTIRKGIRATAIIGIIAYAAIRLLIVKATFEKFGVNPWVFFAIDASTGVVYVLGIEQLVVALAGKGSAGFAKVVAWAAATVLSFLAPYVYLYAAGQTMPPIVALGVGLIVALLLVNAVLLFRRRLRKK
ncbi:MAG TPA: hypothetical protein VLG40_04935 [Candidatus Saccharimonas sp.]|nr:hypothetical protein [Candidatus Saccharimonas sp.]